MSRQEGQKAKLLVLKNILERKTDEDHPLSVPQLIRALGSGPSARVSTTISRPCGPAGWTWS